MKQIPYKSHLFRGTKDALISDKDFDYMIDHFNPVNITVHTINDYAHLDYAWSETAQTDIYNTIIDLIK